jgi:ABC-type glycerol-3-phosphate transport system substrate-binding protein
MIPHSALRARVEFVDPNLIKEKKKEMKKYAYILIAAGIVAATLLAACGPTTPATQAPPQVVTQLSVVTATPEPPTPIPAQPTGNIVLWGWTAAIRDTVEAAGIVTGFNAEYPDITVEIVYYSPQDVYTNLPLAITAGEGAPDVCLVESSHLAEYVYMGGLLDLTDKLQPYLEDIVPYKLVDCAREGKYYCVPWDGGPVVMYYRRDVFEAAGLSADPTEVSNAVATWDDYFTTCQTIKEQTGNYCFAHNKANNYGRLYEMVLWEQGLGYYDAATGDVTVDSAENVATLEMMGRFWDEDLVSDSLEWTDPWYAELASLDAPIATLVEASWMDVFLKSWIAPGTSGKWGVAYMPAFAAGGARAANDGGSNFVIPEQTQNPDAAWAFVEYSLLRPENTLAMFAISGFVPSLKSAYTSPLFMETDMFFGNQNTRTIYADANANIPAATVYGPNYRMMNGSVSVAIQQYATGAVSAQDALTAAAEEIRANLE